MVAVPKLSRAERKLREVTERKALQRERQKETARRRRQTYGQYGRTWPKERDAALQRDQHRCVLCRVWHGRRTPADEVHHLRHRAAGGANELWNLLSMCWSCHATVDKEPRRSLYEVLAGLFGYQYDWAAMGLATPEALWDGKERA